MTANLPAKLEPIPEIDRSAPDRTTRRLPDWLASSTSSVVGDYPAVTIPAAKALTTEQRSATVAHCRRLAEMCQPGPGAQIGKALALLSASFPSQQFNPEVSDARAHGYKLALEDLPGWAVERAVAFWLRREHSEGTENYTFAPLAPQLRRLALIAFKAVADEQFKLKRLLEAKVVEEPKPVSAERRALLADQLIAAIKPVVPPKSEAAA